MTPIYKHNISLKRQQMRSTSSILKILFTNFEKILILENNRGIIDSELERTEGFYEINSTKPIFG